MTCTRHSSVVNKYSGLVLYCGLSNLMCIGTRFWVFLSENICRKNWWYSIFKCQKFILKNKPTVSACPGDMAGCLLPQLESLCTATKDPACYNLHAAISINKWKQTKKNHIPVLSAAPVRNRTQRPIRNYKFMGVHPTWVRVEGSLHSELPTS